MMKINLKTKLISSFTVIIVLTGLITSVIGSVLISHSVLEQVEMKVRTDLNSAREIFNNRIRAIENIIDISALRNCIMMPAGAGDRQALKGCLDEMKITADMDIAVITDKNGRVILRSQNPSVYGDSKAADAVIARVLSTGEPCSSPVIVTEDELLKEGPALLKRVRAVPGYGSSAMMLKAAAPVKNRRGELVGVLYGGDIINGNYAMVDKIRNTVYKGEKYNGHEMGCMTIFQEDLRISTNIMIREEERATGTKVAENVFKRVLMQGKTYIGRAFAVNAWYVTAYEPVIDVAGKTIGMLGLGLLEEKFVDIRKRSLMILFGVTAGGMIVALAVSNILARTITRPINYLVKVSRQISEGDFSIQVDVKSSDELGELERAFNSMTRGLRERDEQLKKDTQQQLMRSEKMAAMGRMAAGIAHEVNNPLTSILIFSHLLLKRFPKGSCDWNDTEIIVHETTRCRDLIRNLLDFSREEAPLKEPGNLNNLIEKTLSIMGKQVTFENIEIIKNLYPDIPMIMLNGNQVEQVLINLLMNASEAMPWGGRIKIETSLDHETGGVFLSVSDTGCGIKEENLETIFDPFFTTKEQGKGTGLGLAVSYGIIKAHGGTISVQSAPGKGTVFTLYFPSKTKEEAEDNIYSGNITGTDWEELL